jgi:hypothetical protein
MKVLSVVAPGFFALVRDVFRDDAYISLSRLTDSSTTGSRENLSLVRLVEVAESGEDSSFASKLRNSLDQLFQSVEGIRLWRNKWLAHIDLQRSLQYDPPPLAPVQRGDIDEALRLIRELMNDTALHLGRECFPYQSVMLIGSAERLASYLEETRREIK